MSKVIEIKKCGDCPHFKRHTSDDGEIIVSATCEHPNAALLSGRNPAVIFYSTIPEWCPLEDKDDFCESNFNVDRPL